MRPTKLKLGYWSTGTSRRRVRFTTGATDPVARGRGEGGRERGWDWEGGGCEARARDWEGGGWGGRARGWESSEGVLRDCWRVCGGCAERDCWDM